MTYDQKITVKLAVELYGRNLRLKLTWASNTLKTKLIVAITLQGPVS
jgi:hypothetical protein